MNADDRQIALARPGTNPLKDKLLCARNLEQGKVFGRRTNENQVGVFRVVEGEQAPALHAKAPVKGGKSGSESVHGKDFTDTGVVVPKHVPRIPGRIVITPAGLRTAHEGCIAEDGPRLFRSSEKAPPESVKCCLGLLRLVRELGPAIPPIDK